MIDPAHWGWPQFLYLALVLLGLGIDLARHGRPKDGTHSFWVSLTAVTVILTVLVSGGFFR